jgi:O-antigen ligase
VSFVINSLELSEDALSRILSLSEKGGFGDYQDDRGSAAAYAFELGKSSPIFGLGVRTTLEMLEGPHNMFIAMFVNYGVVGFIIYVLTILRLIAIAYGSGIDYSKFLWLFCGWLILFSFASHNLIDDTATMPLFGFALAQACQIRAIKQSKRVPAL